MTPSGGTGGSRPPAWTLVGSVGGPGFGRVDEFGGLSVRATSLTLEWWVGADDQHRLPAATGVRQRLHRGVPVVETRMRVPGGDAVHRAFGTGGPGDPVVVEIENESPAPFGAGFVVRGRGRRPEIDGPVLRFGRDPVLVLPRPPGRVSVEHDAMTLEFPVAHRSGIRVASPMDPSSGLPSPAELPRVDAVVRGWLAQLEAGARVELPDERLMAAVDAARAHGLLFDDGVAVRVAPWGRRSRAGAKLLVAALSHWNLSAHVRELAVPRREVPAPDLPDPFAAVEARLAAASPTYSWARGGEGHHGAAVAEFLLAVRALLVRDAGDGVELAPGLPAAWKGRPVDVHGMPVRGGTVSYAVRWHGPRPALLWEGDGLDGARVTAPALDPEWRSGGETAGEVLLAG